MRQIDLWEYEKSGPHRLSVGEWELLREALPSLSIDPVMGTECAYIRPGSTVGAVDIGDLSVLIQPKIGIPQLLSLACYAMGVFKTQEKRLFDFQEEETLPDTLALALAAAARRAFSQGLLHGYRTEEEALRTQDDRLLFFVVADMGGHAARIDMETDWPYASGYRSPMLYEMRLDGFCSLKTWGRDGVLRTKVVIPRAGEMRLNLRTMAHTAIRVQMLDGQTAQPIPGYTWDEAVPISGDHLFARPQWQERCDISELVNRPVRIEIAMREAELFAIRLKCDAYHACEPLQTLW